MYLNFKILSFGVVYKESKVFLPYWFIGLVSNLKSENRKNRKQTNCKICLSNKALVNAVEGGSNLI